MMSLAIDLPVLLVITFAGLAVAPLGLWMVLRRAAMAPDVMAHAVLPGMVLMSALFGVDSIAMVMGALVSAFLGLATTEWVARHARIPSSAAMVMVMSGSFALGAAAIDLLLGRQAHIDVEHFLFGSLDMLIWPALIPAARLSGISSVWDATPVTVVEHVALALMVLVVVFWQRRAMRVIMFSPTLALVLGYRVSWLVGVLNLTATIAVLILLQAMGLAATIAIFICPAVVVVVWGRSFAWLTLMGIAVAITVSWLGHILAVSAITLLGIESWSGAGTVALLQALVVLAAVWGKRRLHQRRSSWERTDVPFASSPK